MIRISITAEAFEAITATLRLGTVGYESEPSPKGERLRTPTKPATHSNRKPATDSDLKPAGVPI